MSVHAKTLQREPAAITHYCTDWCKQLMLQDCHTHDVTELLCTGDLLRLLQKQKQGNMETAGVSRAGQGRASRIRQGKVGHSSAGQRQEVEAAHIQQVRQGRIHARRGCNIGLDME